MQVHSFDGRLEISECAFVPEKPFGAIRAVDRQALVELLDKCVDLQRKRQGVINGFTITMPCGCERQFATNSDIPFEDLPCPCGRDDHYMIQYVKKEQLMCEKCGGMGFTEEDHGLIMVMCDCDKAREVAERNGLLWREDKVDGSQDNFIGLVFELAGKRTNEYSDDELWGMAKKEALTKMEFPYVIVMTCGKEASFDNPSSITNLPIEDIPCSCGNPNHHIVRFIDYREVADDIDSGTGLNNSTLGSDYSSQPQQPKPQRRAKKAGKKSK